MTASTSAKRKPVTPDERLGLLPLPPVASSAALGWPGLRVEHYRCEVDVELEIPALSHHLLILYLQPSGMFSFRSEGLERHGPPPAGSLLLVPAGSWCCPHLRGMLESVHVLIEPQRLARVAAEACGHDPERLTLPVTYGLSHTGLRAAIQALHAELTAGGLGGRLLAESLCNVLAVHLLRQFVAPGQDAPGPRDVLPRRKLQAVVDYIEAHLDAELMLDHLASVSHLSPYHFARLFKNSTGLPPHQYVIARRVERAKQLLRERDRLALTEVAMEVGFASQSHFTRHFKRLVGVTPRRFR
jgi:AraC family transcriptional regulator